MKMGGIGFGRLKGSLATYDHVKSKVFEKTIPKKQHPKMDRAKGNLAQCKSQSKLNRTSKQKQRMKHSSSTYYNQTELKTFMPLQMKSPVQMIPTIKDLDEPRVNRQLFSPTSSSAKSSFNKRQSGVA